MLINRVVVNTSPLICLFKSGLAELFPALFKDVAVPEAVINEVMVKENSFGTGSHVHFEKQIDAN
jgi:predicted nucleic acid-binding protein